MARKASLALLFAAGLIIGMAFTGVFDAPDPVVSAAGAPEERPARSGEIRDFAGKLETLFADAAEAVIPAVVSVQSEKTFRVTVRDPFEEFFDSPFFGGGSRGGQRRQPREQERKQVGVGSGVIIDEKGIILTNNHVVEDATDLKVTLQKGKTYQAELVRSDAKTDLAVIRITDSVRDLPTVKLGNSDNVRIGQWVLAVGSPFQLPHTVSAGIVSATGRSGLGVAQYENWIQTDAAINPGNSGGPLVNLDGEVVGINTFIISRAGGNLGIGFAVPVNMFKSIQDDLLAGREVVRGSIGAYVRDLPPDMAEMFDFKGEGGALVEDLVADGPADKAGIKASDIVTEFGGQAVESANQLVQLVTGTDPGTKVTVKLWRDGTEVSVTVKVGDASEAAAAGEEATDWLGITVRTLSKEAARELGHPDMKGVQVVDIARDSSAARYIGPGDVILYVNRQEVKTAGEYVQQMKRAEDQGRVLLRVYDSDTGRSGHLLLRGRPSS